MIPSQRNLPLPYFYTLFVTVAIFALAFNYFSLVEADNDLWGHLKFGDSEGLLLDLRESPEEQDNLRTERVAVFNEFTERIRRYERELEPRPAIHRATRKPITTPPGEFPAKFTLSPAEEKALRALGYRD